MGLLDHVVYINLDRRLDRRAAISAELASMEVSASRFPAIEHREGAVGCGQSHLAVLKLAKERRWPSVLILEDDFTFVVGKAAFHAAIGGLDAYRRSHPVDVCFLAHNILRASPVSDDAAFVRVWESRTASGYLVFEHYYDRLIELYEWAIPQLEKTGQHWVYATDACWTRLQEEGHWIAFANRIGRQRPGYSDNARMECDHGC